MLEIQELFYKEINGRNRAYYRCKCDCSNIKDVRTDCIDKIISCGCFNEEHNQYKQSIIIGKKDKAFTVLKQAETRTKNRNAPEYLCKCNRCKKNVILEGSKILKYTSCGCSRSESGRENGKKARKIINELYVKNGTNILSINKDEPLRNNTSGYKNITWDKEKCKWAVRLVYKGKSYHIDRFDDIEFAVKVRNLAREARINDNLAEWIRAYRESKQS
jgi:hypothetical protein